LAGTSGLFAPGGGAASAVAHINPALSVNVKNTRSPIRFFGAASIGNCGTGLTVSMKNTALKILRGQLERTSAAIQRLNPVGLLICERQHEKSHCLTSGGRFTVWRITTCMERVGF
jgi:hypothetical protein